jgi:hypothetical protein
VVVLHAFCGIVLRRCDLYCPWPCARAQVRLEWDFCRTYALTLHGTAADILMELVSVVGLGR